MQTIKQILLAGQTWQMAIPASFMQLVTAAAPVRIRFMQGGRVVSECEDVEQGFYCNIEQFDRVEITASVTQLIKIILSDGTAGSSRIAGDVSATVRGGSTVLNVPMKSVGIAETLVAEARADRIALRVLNAGVTNIALMAPGGNIADAAIVIAPGDLWNEEAAPAAAWVGISDAAGGMLKVQELVL